MFFSSQILTINCLFATTFAFLVPARLPTTREIIMSCNDAKSSGYKILALHGKGENGDAFRKRLEKLVDLTPQVSWEFLTAPHLIGDDGEFAWWTLPPKIRSFEATEYNGIEETFKEVPPITLSKNAFN